MNVWIGALAAIASITRAWPQVFRLLKKNSAVEGVSVLTWCIGTAGQSGWVIYAIGNHVVPAIISNTLNDIGCIAVLFAACRVRSDARSTVVRSLIPMLVIEMIVLGIFGATKVGIIVAVLSAITFVPQVVRVLRKSGEGVSQFTWILITLSTVLWGIYGILIHKLILSYPTLIILPSGLIVLAVTLRKPPSSTVVEVVDAAL